MPSAPLTIRAAAKGDADGIALVMFRSHTENYVPFAPAAWIETVQYDVYAQRWQKRLTEGNHHVDYFVATQNGSIVGMMGVQSAVGWPHEAIACNHSNAPASKTGVIRNAHVLPEMLGQGVGSALYQRCVQYARERGMKMLFMDTAAENTRSRTFFEKHGWTFVTAVPDAEVLAHVIYCIDLAPD